MAESRWSNPVLVVAFLALGAAPDGEPVGCRVVEITPGQTWDVIPAVSANIAPFSRMQTSVSIYGGTAVGASFHAEASPVTYAGPGDQGPAIRITTFIGGAPAALPSGTVVQVRASRCSAS